MIHNHEVGGSIPPLATTLKQSLQRDTGKSQFPFFCIKMLKFELIRLLFHCFIVKSLLFIMAELKLVIVPAQQAKDGSHKIRVAIYHQSQTRYIVQPIVIDNEKQFKDGQVVGRPDAGLLNRKLRVKLNEYQDALDNIDANSYTVAQLKSYLEKSTKAKAFSISQAAEEHIAKKKKKNTQDSYRRTLRYFVKYIGDVPLEMITSQMISEFDRLLEEKRNMSSTSRAIHLRQLKAFIVPQIKYGNVTYRVPPFVDVVIPESRERVLDITVQEFKLIRDADVKEKHLCVARDLFCLSYYLGGINLIDLMDIDFKRKDVIEYVREKSRNTKRGDKMISLTIQPEAKAIIDRWIGRNGKLDFGYNYSYDNFRSYVTANIRKLAKVLKIDKRVVYYSARKSLVQHGFELGVSLEVLEYSIGQSMKRNRPIFNYIRIMRTHADEAMRLILDNLK